MSNPGHDDGPSLEQQVAFLKQQLAQAQKLTALGDLISTTTHEFNNVLMTIINYAKMGMRHKDTATRDKAFDKILVAANRAAKITTGILGFARNRSQSLEPTDLIRVIDDSLVLLERELTKYRVRVETSIDRATPSAMANGNQIQQVLMNLLINARQAMPQGGLILIKLGYDAASQMVELSVRDTGSGMTPEVLHKIFDPYFSTKSGPDASGKGGTGLGLSSCRDIVESHRGRIRVDSTLGKGTAFTIKLPAVIHHGDTEGAERTERRRKKGRHWAENNRSADYHAHQCCPRRLAAQFRSANRRLIASFFSRHGRVSCPLFVVRCHLPTPADRKHALENKKSWKTAETAKTVINRAKRPKTVKNGEKPSGVVPSSPRPIARSRSPSRRAHPHPPRRTGGSGITIAKLPKNNSRCAKSAWWTGSQAAWHVTPDHQIKDDQPPLSPQRQGLIVPAVILAY